MRLFHKSFLAGFLFTVSVTSSFAEPRLRIGPVEGMTDSWRAIPDEIELPLGAAAQLEFTWGLNRADLNADGRVDLLDYATLSLCFSVPGGQRPNSCDALSYLDSDLDADGDVDIDDANAFNQAMDDPQPYAVGSVIWIGANEVSLTALRTRADLDLSELGAQLVRVESAMTDPITQQEIQLLRQV